MKIEERVQLCMDHCDQNRWDAALEVIFPAVEATARNMAESKKITGAQTKDFIRKNYSIIEPFSCTGLNMRETKFPNVVVETDDDKILENPDVADILYHCLRNALSHGYPISEKFAFSKPLIGLGAGWSFNFGEGRIHLPTNIVYALVAVVVFSKANAPVVSNTGSWLNLWVEGVDVKFQLGLLWGAEDQVLRFFEKHPPKLITMHF